MKGDWIAATARLLVYEQTRTSVISPAIADLQFESAGTPTVRQLLQGYAGVYRALLGAIVLDLRADVAFVCIGRSPGKPWLQMNFFISALIAYHAWHILPRTSDITPGGPGAWLALLASRLPPVVFEFLPLLIMLRAASLIEAGQRGRRAIVLLTLAASALEASLGVPPIGLGITAVVASAIWGAVLGRGLRATDASRAGLLLLVFWFGSVSASSMILAGFRPATSPSGDWIWIGSMLPVGLAALIARRRVEPHAPKP